MTPVSEAVERLLTIRAELEGGTLDPTPDLMLEALEAGATLAEEQRTQIARLTEQVRVAKEGLAGLAVYPGSASGARKIALETLTRMEKNDDAPLR